LVWATCLSTLPVVMTSAWLSETSSTYWTHMSLLYLTCLWLWGPKT
jgi:hypothetical protein